MKNQESTNNVTILHFLKLADSAYDDFDESKENKGFAKAAAYGFRYVDSVEKYVNNGVFAGSGYYGVVFEKDNAIYVCHRGTNFWDKGVFSDLASDINMAFGRAPGQYRDALKFSLLMHSKYGEGKEIIQVGHSLGDALAKMVGIATNTRSVGFDGPGIKEFAQNIFTKEQIERNLDKMESWAALPHYFNTIGEHFKVPTRIVFDSEVDKIDFSFGVVLGFTAAQHPLKNIIKAIDPETGMPFKTILYDNWPNWNEGPVIAAKEFLINHPNSEIDVSFLNSDLKAVEKILGINSCLIKLINNHADLATSGGTFGNPAVAPYKFMVLGRDFSNAQKIKTPSNNTKCKTNIEKLDEPVKASTHQIQHQPNNFNDAIMYVMNGGLPNTAQNQKEHPASILWRTLQSELTSSDPAKKQEAIQKVMGMLQPGNADSFGLNGLSPEVIKQYLASFQNFAHMFGSQVNPANPYDASSLYASQYQAAVPPVMPAGNIAKPKNGSLKPMHISLNIDSDNAFASFHKCGKTHYFNDSSVRYATGKNYSLVSCGDLGAEIFIQGNTVYAVGGRGADKFYFDLTNSKTTEGITSVIDKFQDGIDKIFFHEKDTTLSYRDIILTVNSAENYTMLSVDFGGAKSGVAIVGEHPELLNDLVLNEA